MFFLFRSFKRMTPANTEMPRKRNKTRTVHRRNGKIVKNYWATVRREIAKLHSESALFDASKRLTPAQFQLRYPGMSQSDAAVIRPGPLDSGRAKEAMASHIRGALYGLAVVDALGAPVEFKARGTFPLVTSMLPNHNFKIQNPNSSVNDDYISIPPGCFTDDTSMALCLAHSLLDTHSSSNGELTNDTVSQVRNYLKWMREGYMSSVNECFDVGAATSSALKEWGGLLREYDEQMKLKGVDASDGFGEEQRREKVDGDKEGGVNVRGETIEGVELNKKQDEKLQLSPKDSVPLRSVHRDLEREQRMLLKVSARFNREDRCGNGSLMRVLPVSLLNLSLPEKSNIAEQSSMPTHSHKRCRDACVLYTWIVSKALEGVGREQLATGLAELLEKGWSDNGREREGIDDVLKERLLPYKSTADWQRKSIHQIWSSGYVVDTLEASLWAFISTNTFQDGAIKVVNLGDDADTVGVEKQW